MDFSLKENTLPDETLGLVKSPSPVMVVVGEALDSSQILIVAEGKVLMEAVELTQAVEFLLAVYFVLNLQYPKQCISTFLFYQKQVLNISDKQKIPVKLISFVSKLV